MSAVSYTHLDVYKRQFMNSGNLTPDGKSVGNDRQQVRVDDQLTQLAGHSLVGKYRKQLRAVSYTHLDVYKRQE